jgi:hypothetical protein
MRNGSIKLAFAVRFGLRFTLNAEKHFESFFGMIKVYLFAVLAQEHLYQEMTVSTTMIGPGGES